MAESFSKDTLPKLKWYEHFYALGAFLLLWIGAIHVATRIYWLTHPAGVQ